MRFLTTDDPPLRVAKVMVGESEFGKRAGFLRATRAEDEDIWRDVRRHDRGRPQDASISDVHRSEHLAAVHEPHVVARDRCAAPAGIGGAADCDGPQDAIACAQHRGPGDRHTDRVRNDQPRADVGRRSHIEPEQDHVGEVEQTGKRPEARMMQRGRDTEDDDRPGTGQKEDVDQTPGARERDGLDGVFKSSDADALLTLVRTIGRATTHLQA